ncbi:MAG: PQQ-binding-like beta-propeller repeat protein, partial [Nitrososphaera sp.]
SELFTCSPSIGANGTIYIASSMCDCVLADSGFIYAFYPDGSIKWRFKTQNSNFSTGALEQDGTYFYGSLDNHLYAIDREGNLKWKQKLGPFQLGARPAITKTGEVIVAVGSGVTALHAETGNILWFYEKQTRFGFSVSIANDGTIYTGTVNSLLALTPIGLKKWELQVPYGPREVMIGHDGTLYFHILRDSLFYALNPDGSLKWTFNVHGEPENNSPAIGQDGSLYAMNSTIHPQKLYKLSLSGRVEWEIEFAKLTGRIGYLADTSPMIDKDGTIYINYGFTGSDNFYTINQNRQVKWRLTIDHPSVAIFPTPAIAPDGMLYIAGDHSLNAIK